MIGETSSAGNPSDPDDLSQRVNEVFTPEDEIAMDRQDAQPGGMSSEDAVRHLKSNPQRLEVSGRGVEDISDQEITDTLVSATMYIDEHNQTLSRMEQGLSSPESGTPQNSGEQPPSSGSGNGSQA